jgi:hypothetical protein
MGDSSGGYIAVYGVFDLAAEWNFEQVARPFDRVTEKLLGVPPGG